MAAVPEVDMISSGPIEDRLAIRELLEAYADAVFRKDADAWAACWAEDAVWDFAGTRLEGRATIVATWRAAMAPFSLAIFYVYPAEIVVSEDSATMRSYTQEKLLLAAGGERVIFGGYEDELIRTGDGWRFARRSYSLLHEDAPAPGAAA